MRPVERGRDPGGYTEYALARPALMQRIGYYCTYCEARLKNGQVEHILPKHHFPEHEADWSNFIFACGNCNPTKGAWPTRKAGRSAAYWPDTDNTSGLYDYGPDAPPRVASVLTKEQRKLAQALLVRTGVDRSPIHPKWSLRDDRWELRQEAWGIAVGCRTELAAEDTPVHRNSIAGRAAAGGFWSVWRAVFATDLDMLLRINTAFVGTSPACFDAAAQPVPRPGGRL
jgi:hypothetical protein